MNRQQSILAAVILLGIALLFALIFGPPSCVHELSDEIGQLLTHLDQPATSCDDGIDNDNDGFIDSAGGPNGEPPDDKCLALNDPHEVDNLALHGAATVGSRGGLLVLGDLFVDIPPQALQHDTTIAIERVPGVAENQLSYADAYNLTPDGLVFQQPITITLRIRPDDPHLTTEPWLFTELPDKTKVLLEHIDYLRWDNIHWMIGAQTHFSKKGGDDFETFKNQVEAHPVSGDCFSDYSAGPCPDDAALCHASLRGDVPCASCLVRAPRDYCCVCPPDFPMNDLPCENNGRPIVLFPECQQFEYSKSGNTCDDFLNALPKNSNSQKFAGITFSHIEAGRYRWGTVNTRQVGNKFCTTPTISDVTVPLSVNTAYPHWNNAASCQVEWDRFSDKLQTHEKGHADIAKQEATRLQGEVEAQHWNEVCAPTQQEATDIAHRTVDRGTKKLNTAAQARLESAEKTYDEQTQNGATQGATLDCNACR